MISGAKNKRHFPLAKNILFKHHHHTLPLFCSALGVPLRKIATVPERKEPFTYYNYHKVIKRPLLLLCLCCYVCWFPAMAQIPGSLRPDTSNKPDDGKWRDEDARMTYTHLHSRNTHTTDTSIQTFHRRPYLQPWLRDLGNLGSPAYNLLFTPYNRTGPTLGYNIFDTYRFSIDSTNYYNTHRPYSEFTYQLGSKLEQSAGILHTQNILPNWNVAAAYRKTNSPGFFKIARNIHDNATFSTNYQSPGKHYTLHAAMVYNKQQHDENGGIVNGDELTNPLFTDRKIIDVAYQSSGYSATRSSVSNTQRDFTAQLQHSYTWGKTDTTYNTDSSEYNSTLTPRFSITHRLRTGTEKHTYKDLTPDSLRYFRHFQQGFINKGTGLYSAGSDSVYTVQKWHFIDNAVLLGGYLGTAANPLQFTVGAGNRLDRFISDPVRVQVTDSLPKVYYTPGSDQKNYVSNYITGTISKEALQPGQWGYMAHTLLYVTGSFAGNLQLQGTLSKTLKNNLGSISAGMSQQVNSAPYAYATYQNMYARNNFSFSKESITQLHATISSPRLALAGGVRNYLLANYIYLDAKEQPAQYGVPINLLQAWGHKTFRIGNFAIDNELVWQQLPTNAPINIPAIMGRNQISYQRSAFKRALKFATGVEVRYNSKYAPSGYSAVLNRFFYQNNTTVQNKAELAAFMNVKIKRFRAFIMVDNIQQAIFTKNAILFTATTVPNFNNTNTAYTPIYVAPDLVIRFGFTWVMSN